MVYYIIFIAGCIFKFYGCKTGLQHLEDNRNVKILICDIYIALRILQGFTIIVGKYETNTDSIVKSVNVSVVTGSEIITILQTTR